MKLCYLWVEHFKNFKNFELNFSNDFKFSYSRTEHRLRRTRAEPLPSDFFPRRLEAVTGIVGRNGAGKSNALELVCNVLKGARRSIRSDFFIIVKQFDAAANRSRYVAYYSFASDNPPAYRGIEFLPHPGRLPDLKVIFFSNVSDERRNDFDADVADLSANRRNGMVAGPQDLTPKDFRDQIALIDSPHYEILKEIGAPKQIHIVNKMWSSAGAMQRTLARRNGFATVDIFRNKIRKRLRDLSPESRFVATLQFAYFIEMVANCVEDDLNETKADFMFPEIDNVFREHRDESTEKLAQIFVDHVCNKVLSHPGHDFKSNRVFKHPTLNDCQLIEMQRDFLDGLKSRIVGIGIHSHFEGTHERLQENFVVDYASHDQKALIHDLARAMSYFGTISIGWLGISSGQRAYLTLFASVYEELRRVASPNVLLCIDEGDLYLHPKWQIEFFDKLATLLPAMFRGKIQLVLTSHSPFLLSDLPRENIQVLDPDEGKREAESFDAPTFAGNLYDLYSGPLFLGDDDSGVFAQRKVMQFLRVVYKAKHDAKDRIFIDRFLRILGDEMLKFKVRKKIENA